MSVSKNDVKNAYRFVLGREPESEDVIRYWENHANSWQELRNSFLVSDEYKREHASDDLSATASHEDYYLKKCDGDFFWCLRSDGDDNVSQGIRKNGRWGEAEEFKNITKKLIKNKKSGEVLLDLGANIGAISVPFAKDGWHVISVEAGSRNVGALQITSKLNDLDIEVLPYIVHEHTGKMQFWQNGPWGQITNDMIHVPGAELLDAFRLDDLERVAGHTIDSIDMVKIDIEGSEVAAVRGGTDFFRKYDYPSCFCEANRWTLMAQGESVRSLKDAFAQLGYRPYVLRDGKLVEVFDPEKEIATVVNYYFVHKSHSANEFISNEVLQIAKDDYADRVLEYIKSNASWFDDCCRTATLMVIKQSQSLMNHPWLREYADQLESNLREDAVLSKVLDCAMRK